jgi:hypothetical protein
MGIIRFILLFTLATKTFAASEVTLAFIRYQPEKKTDLLAPVRLNIPAAKLRTDAILTELKKKGTAALIYQTTELLPEDKPKQFEKTENATVLLPGEETEFPKITKLALKFQIQDTGRHHLAWNGTIHWSPEIFDQTQKFLTQPKTNVTIIRPFAPAGNTTGFEYPVLKQTTFQSSKLAKDGELIITSTTAESGGRPPELLLLCLWAFSK